MSKRPEISSEIKRAVRQKCFFGCILCGAPIYHYDHIEEYSTVNKHQEKNITLLCPNHHQDKTSKRISKDIIREKTASPYNKNNQFTSPYTLFMGGKSVNLRVGGNQYMFDFNGDIDRFDAIRFNGKSVVGIKNENGNLLLDLCMTDKCGNEILKVTDGEIQIYTGAWDFNYTGKKLTFNSAPREIQFQMSIHDDGIEIIKGYFHQPPNWLEILADKHILWPMKLSMSGNISRGSRVGLDINSL